MKNKIKIFVYTGSCNAHSTTAKLAEQLVSTIDEITKVDVAADFYSGSNTLIKECVGCTQCFIQGRCALDARDDMPVLRQKMMEADCIILGSPVYFHAVSGNMKTFMDRLSSWTHTMECAGKIGAVVAASGGNGLNYVTDYLKKFMDYLGIVNLGSIGAATYNESYMTEQKITESLRPEFTEVAERIRAIYEEGEVPQPDDLQRQVFLMNNKKYKELEEYRDNAAEIRKWLDNGYTSYSGFDDVIRDRFFPDKCDK